MLFKKVVAAAVFSVSLIAAAPAFAYDVKPGDTMNEIARSHGMSLGELTKLNPSIENPNKIYPGQTIKTEANNNNEPVKTSYSATAAERDLMARLIQAEAGGEIYAGKVAVGVVVMNRVHSGYFPNTITAVINQKGQFSPVGDGSIHNTPSADSKRAVTEALATKGGKGSIYFYNSKTATNRWLDSRPTTIVIGNHTFKK
jgi:N-acetylmuramoyl-L-alanine amidase